MFDHGQSALAIKCELLSGEQNSSLNIIKIEASIMHKTKI